MSMQFIKPENQNKRRGQLVYGIDPDAEGMFEDGRRWKGLVICRIENCAFDVYSVLAKAFKNTPVDFDYVYDEYCGMTIEDTYTAMAKCSVEDKFDVEKGMEIARNRALKKYRADKARVLSEFEIDMIMAMSKVGREMNFLIDKISEE